MTLIVNSVVPLYFFATFAIRWKGRVAEWLGTGLQNLLQRFESVRDLSKSPFKKGIFFITIKSALFLDGWVDSLSFLIYFWNVNCGSICTNSLHVYVF